MDVCYIVSHGFSSRMVFQTGLLAKLAAKGKKVSVISPDKNDANLVDYCKKQGVELHEFRVSNSLLKVDYSFMRKYFLEDIRNNPGLWAKHLHSTKGNTSKNPYFRLRPYVYYQVYKMIKVFPFIRTWFKRYEDRLLDSAKAIQLLKEINPKLVVATYPVNMPESMLLRAAQKLGIKTSIHLLSWDNITCKGYFPATAEYYVAWGPIMEQEFKEYYQATDENVFACGVPHFDEHNKVKDHPDFEEFVNELGLDGKKPYLFVAMSSPYFAPKGIDVIEWLADQVEKNAFGEEMQLIVRPHPQNVQGGMADLSWRGRLEGLKSKRVGVDYPSLVQSKLPWSMQDHDMRRLSNLLAGCVVCINFGSTVSIDALMVERPVIVVAFDAHEELPWYKSGRRQMDYIHYKKLIEMGGVKVAYSFEEFTKHLHLYINDPDADWDLRQYTLSMECGVNDGKATDRVADALAEILERNQPALEVAGK